MAQLSHQKSENASVKVAYGLWCGGSAWAHKHLQRALVTWPPSPHAAELCLTMSLDSVKRKRKATTAWLTTKQRPKRQSVKGGTGKRHWEETLLTAGQKSVLSHVAAQEEQQPEGTASRRGMHLGLCWSLLLGFLQVHSITSLLTRWSSWRCLSLTL